VSESLFEGPAIRVQQPIGEFWVAAIPADALLRATASDRLRIVADPAFRHDSDEWRTAIKLLGNQRPLAETRLKKISAYIDSIESTFPNSIILAANVAPLVGSAPNAVHGPDWRIEGDLGKERLIIPQGARLASVVDGQHRLYAFLRASSEARKSFHLICSIFFDLPEPMQALVFATINTNQTPVRRGLALNLYGYNVEDEDRQYWSPEKLAVFIARRLNYDDDSRLKLHIKIEADNAPKPELLPGATRAIPMAAIVDGVLGLITRDAKRDRDLLKSTRLLVRPKRAKLPSDDAPLRAWYVNSIDRDLYLLVRGYLNLVYDRVWSAAGDRSMLARAVGVRALMSFLSRYLVAHAPPAATEGGSEKTLTGIRRYASKAFDRAAAVDFSDPFFEASGRGQTRLLNVLLSTAGDEPSYPPDESGDYRRVLRRVR
jgi:DNA phosphorothioation-associated DGQHR protein 1